MSKIKVSVIIPVYNAEHYIENCLKSVMQQTLQDIEIVVINDGSTDKSGEIVKNLTKNDNRIIYLETENQGVGSARNMGIEISRGDYLGFIDSDDTIEKNMFEKMYGEAERYNADIVECRYNVINNGTIVTSNKENEEEIVVENVYYNLNDFLKKYYFGNKKYGNHVWSKLIKHRIIKEKKIVFGNLKYITGEDLYFGLTILPYINKIVFLNDKLYNYYIRKNSIMNTYDSSITERTINFIKEIEKYGKNFDNIYDKFLSTYLYNLCVATARVFINNNRVVELKEKIHIIVNDPVVIKYANKINYNDILFSSSKKKYFMKVLSNSIINSNKKILYAVLRIHHQMIKNNILN